MKKLMAVALVLVCVLGMAGCNQPDQNTVDDIDWVDGIAFIELAPGEETKSADEIAITGEHDKVAYTITYARLSLKLEIGLVASDGTEYVQEIVGGSETGYIENIPAGTYYLVVRNSGDYASLPSYQNGSESYNATGAINYSVE